LDLFWIFFTKTLKLFGPLAEPVEQLAEPVEQLAEPVGPLAASSF
jgi:hypothetical protein